MARGGKRPNSGRPRGKKEPQTLEKERIQEVLRQRIMQSAGSLFNAAKSTAIGNQFLYRIETITDSKGKKTRSKPILVESEFEIMEYIDRLDKENRGESIDEDENNDVYYFISTKEPSIQAIKELWDRAFGKPTETLEMTGKEGKPLEIGIRSTLKRIYGKDKPTSP